MQFLLGSFIFAEYHSISYLHLQADKGTTYVLSVAWHSPTTKKLLTWLLYAKLSNLRDLSEYSSALGTYNVIFDRDVQIMLPSTLTRNYLQGQAAQFENMRVN